MSLLRVDQVLLKQKLVDSRTIAQKLVREKKVQYLSSQGWKQVKKPSLLVELDCQFKIAELEELRFVSRAGLKMEGALSRLEIELKNRVVLDIGQSTGGFSDCLLQCGVREIIGVDVGHGQVHKRIGEHSQVTCLEGLNARLLWENDYLYSRSKEINLVVMDVSFISQTLIFEELARELSPGALLLSLVKPQFEVGPNGIGKGGLVKNPALYQDVEQVIKNNLQKRGFKVLDYFISPIKGGDGNLEYFVYAAKR